MSEPIAIDLAPLPQGRSRWKLFVGSFGAQCVAVFLLTQLAVLTPTALIMPKHYEITNIMAPPLEDFTTPPAAPAVVRTHPRLVAPKLETREDAALHVPPPPVEKPPAAPRIQPDVVSSIKPPVVTEEAKPAPVVHTGAFGAAAVAAQAPNLRPQQVQTGGFGDPNGSRSEGVARPQLPQMRVGSFDLAAGPGYGNGAGGTRGARGAVASADFGTVGGAPTPTPRGSGSVQTGGFGDARPAAAERRTAPAASAPVITPVEIISKPRPAYTEEARRLKIEGEVLLQARFCANGELQVLGVLRGLGHGLDESAMRAAQQIRFRPARQDGVPVDSVASLHVVFQLAY